MYPVVYLCGSITKNPAHISWRKEVEEKLAKNGIAVLSPLRGKDLDKISEDGLGTDDVGERPFSAGGFVARDLLDIRNSDALLLFFEDTISRQSIGTWTEFGYAVSEQIPIVVCSTLHEVVAHPFIYKLATRITPTIDIAVEYLTFLLN